MATPLRLTFWTKAVEVAALAAAICFSLGASSPTSRINTLSHSLMCQCGCAQLLGECDHVGCPDRGQGIVAADHRHCRRHDRPADFRFICRQIRRDCSGCAYDEGIRPGGVDCAVRGVCRRALSTILLIRRWGGLGGQEGGACDAGGRECQSGRAGAAAADSPGDRRRRSLSDDGNNGIDCRDASSCSRWCFTPSGRRTDLRARARRHRRTICWSAKSSFYENLRDLNFEYRAGKYPEEDFEAQRALLEHETAQLLAEIDHLEHA